MGYLLHVGLAVATVVLAEAGFALPGERPLLVVLLALVPHALAAATRRAGLRGRFRLAGGLHATLVWSPPALQGLALVAAGWGATVARWTGQPAQLLGWPTPALLLDLAPFVAYGLLAIDARARVAPGRPLGDSRRFHARLFLSALLPLPLYVGASFALGLDPTVQVLVEEVGAVGAAFAVAVILVFVAILPWALTRVWSTQSMPAGPRRELLEAVARHARFRCRDLLLWRTGGSMANAAILGFSPRTRFVLFSDALLAQLGPRELAAVFGHEIGHARRRHVLVFAAWSASLFLLADLVGARWSPSWDPDGDWAWMPVLALVLGVWYVTFGYLSRRFELEADLEGVALTNDPAAMAEALSRVGGVHGSQRGSWRHFSTSRRIAFLAACQADPEVGHALRRRLRGWGRVGLVLLAIVAALEAWHLADAWPTDRVVADLRLGRYGAARERVERGQGVEPEVAALARLAGNVEERAAEDGAVPVATLLGAARAALRSGEVEVAAGLLDLAALRGDHEAWALRRALKHAHDGEGERARELVAEHADAWRDELEAFLRRPARRAAR